MTLTEQTLVAVKTELNQLRHLETKYGNSYTAETRMLFYTMLRHNVPAKHATSLLRSLLEQVGITPDDLPGPSLVKTMFVEMGVLSQIQCGEVLAELEMYALQTDETTSLSQSFMAYVATFRSGRRAWKSTACAAAGDVTESEDDEGMPTMMVDESSSDSGSDSVGESSGRRPLLRSIDLGVRRVLDKTTNHNVDTFRQTIVEIAASMNRAGLPFPTVDEILLKCGVSVSDRTNGAKAVGPALQALKKKIITDNPEAFSKLSEHEIDKIVAV